jgi:aminopeptidase YwaD
MSCRALPLSLALALGVPAAATDIPTARIERLSQDVRILAGERWQGRRSGTPGADAAAAWIADEFRELGLAPGAAGGYLQRFSYIEGARLGRGNRLTVANERYRPGRDFRPLAFSSSEAAEGEVVFAGYGISAPNLGYDDYAGVEVRGRVVLVLRYAPRSGPAPALSRYASLRRKAAEARRRGAAGLLVATGWRGPARRDDLVPFRIDASLRDAGLPVVSVKRPIGEALFYGSGRSLREAERAIEEQGSPSSQQLAMRVELVTDLEPLRAATQNVIGVVPGRDPRENVVVGAHYDHLGNGGAGSLDGVEAPHLGADDNASGTAGLLELARSLVSRPGGLRRNVIFIAFGAEELGLLGSTHFVENPTVPMESVVAMANLDMIGRLESGPLGIHGVGTSPIWPTLVEEAARGLDLKIRLHDDGFGPSDHASFLAAERPVLFFFTGLHSDYHRTGDTPDKIDTVGLARIVSLAERVVERLAMDAEPVPFAGTPR